MEHPIGALPRTPFPASRDFPSRGNEKIGGTGYCVTYDTDSQSRNVLASPLGEEGHEVAKGVQAKWIHRGAPRPANPVRRHPAKSVWTVVILIMIIDVDVTAEGGIIKLIARKGDTTTLGAKGPVKLKNPPAKGRSILRTFRDLRSRPPLVLRTIFPPASGGTTNLNPQSSLALIYKKCYFYKRSCFHLQKCLFL